jgi:dGTPase
MEENVAIRNRLTHSHEVSNLARSIGVRIAFEYAEKVFKDDHERLQVKRNVPALLAAVGLAHDLGNPPFGHQGEIAMREWFLENEDKTKQHDDFLEFDGNAQTFRLLTRLQVLNDEYGLNLTVATLAALMKYPSFHDSKDRGGFKKFGVFRSEEKIARDVWAETGLDEGVRHPLAYIMEACDDIAYSVIDAEDTVKKSYASYYDLIDYLQSNAGDDEIVSEVLDASRKKNDEFRKESLSSRELNDISMQMFRVKAIAMMIVAVTNVFVEHVDAIMSGDISKGFELVKNSPCAALCSTLKQFDHRHGFQHSEVLKLELEGNNYIKGMMDLFWKAISRPEGDRNPFEKYAYGKISENYRRVYESSPRTQYDAQRLLCDAISGMTEQFLIKEHGELRGLLDGPA